MRKANSKILKRMGCFFLIASLSGFSNVEAASLPKTAIVETSERNTEDKGKDAVGQKVTASDSESGDYGPEKVIDGIVDFDNPNLQSRWSSDPASTQKWLQLDLGEEKHFNEVIIEWERKNAVDYQILISKDGEAWESAYEAKECPSDYQQSISLDKERDARYVKLVIDRYEPTAAIRQTDGTEVECSKNSVSIFEFQVINHTSEESSIPTPEPKPTAEATKAAAPGEYPKSYTLYPTPQTIVYGEGGVQLKEVNIVMTKSADAPTKEKLEKSLQKHQVAYTFSDQLSTAKPNIILGIVKDDVKIQESFDALGLSDVSALDKLEGYVAAVKNGSIYIMGSKPAALYYGVVTLSQMLDVSTNVKDVLINDYSDNLHRGTVEGYYGIPWGNDARADIINMMGKYKMNEYVYAPKDDPYHFGDQWYEPYPSEQLAALKGLVDTAKSNHVEFIYTLHISEHMDLSDEDDGVNQSLPVKTGSQWDQRGNDSDRGVTVPPGQHEIDAYSADETFNRFVSKFDQLYQIGVRQFGILADDISFPLARYGIPYTVNFLNKVQTYLKTTYPDVKPLMFCPTYYHQADTNYNGKTYMRYIRDGLDSEIEVMWTGNHVMANVNQSGSQSLYNWIGRKPLIWWNYPVTDYVPRYILLGPNPGLEANATNMTGILSNPMQQGFASEVSLFGVADYSWNLDSYNREQAWKDSFTHLFPEVADSLYLIAQNAATGYDTRRLDKNQESVYLVPYLEAFKTAVAGGDKGAIGAAGSELAAQFQDLLNAVQDVRTNCQSPGLIKDLTPWLDKLESLCTVGNEVVKAYSSTEATDIWNSYSVINSEMNSWPSITVEQLAGGKVAAEIGIAHLTPFIKEMVKNLEVSLNQLLLTGDKATNQPAVISNLSDTSGMVLEKKDLEFIMTPGKEISLRPHQFAGMKLDGAYLVNEISLNGYTSNKIGVEYSLNGVEWQSLKMLSRSNSITADLQGSPVRYLRIINKTKEAVSLQFNELKVKVTGPRPAVIREAVSTMGLYNNNGPMNLVDGSNKTAYWTNGNQKEGQEVILTYEKPFKLYDFALYEDLNDYIRNGSIYTSTDGKEWNKIGGIGTNFLTETVGGQAYNIVRGYGNGVETQYIKIATESTANNWTKIYEWEMNQTVSGTSGLLYPFTAVADGTPAKIADGDLTTLFSSASEECSLSGTLTEYNAASSMVVLQNGQNISNAKLSIRSADGWHETGTLKAAFNSFDLSGYPDVLEWKLTWEKGVVPQINEIYTITTDPDKSGLEAEVEKGKAIQGQLTSGGAAHQTLQDAVWQGEAVLKDPLATRGSIAEAIKKLQTAINGGKEEQDKEKAQQDFRKGAPKVTVKAEDYNKVKVSWQAYSNADRYQVLRKTAGSAYQKLATVTQLSYIDKKAVPGVTYYYTVKALSSKWGQEVSSKYNPGCKVATRLAKAKLNKTAATSASSIKLEFKKINGAAGHQIYRSDSKNGKYQRVGVVTKGTTLIFKDQKGLKAGKTYYYKIRAYCKADGKYVFGSYSDTKSVKLVPEQVKILKVTAGKKYAVVKYRKAVGVKGYVIYRADRKNGPYKKVKQVGSKTLSYKNTGLKSNRTYYYKVRAYYQAAGKKVYGAYSAAYSVKVK